MNTRTKIILGSKRAFSRSIDNMLIERMMHVKPFMQDCELCEAGGEEYCDACRGTHSRILENSRKESA